ncbi:MAG: lysophospholipid acyltransferase family protein [Opitutaceae bacterium]|nr:lysophospholipid acyltransferase family protein [Opitutaceae bacterium]
MTQPRDTRPPPETATATGDAAPADPAASATCLLPPLPPPPSPPATTGPRKKPARIHQVNGLKRAALWPLAVFLHLWNATLHVTTGPASASLFTRTDRPFSFALWHNRTFIIADQAARFRPTRPLHALTSASKDGALMGAFLEMLGIRVIRGSSSNYGREAATALIAALRRGSDIGLTPDGPRGPRYTVKPGTVIVAKNGRSPIVAFGAAFESAWILRSWDGFRIPRPFSRVHLYGRLISLEEMADTAAAIAALAATLKALNPDVEEDPRRLDRVI